MFIFPFRRSFQPMHSASWYVCIVLFNQTCNFYEYCWASYVTILGHVTTRYRKLRYHCLEKQLDRASVAAMLGESEAEFDVHRHIFKEHLNRRFLCRMQHESTISASPSNHPWKYCFKFVLFQNILFRRVFGIIGKSTSPTVQITSFNCDNLYLKRKRLRER